MTGEADTENNREPFLDLPKQNLLALSIISAIVYMILAWLIFYFFRGTEITSAFDHGYSLGNQLLTGIVCGCTGAGIIAFLMNRPPVSGVLNDFYIVRVLKELRLTKLDCIQLSLFAGAGEELLFRGAIQPLLGIWVTSIIFIGLHGYFKFQKMGHLAFGTMMFGLSVGLGYVYDHAGLVAAMTAHAVSDMIMLFLVSGRES